MAEKRKGGGNSKKRLRNDGRVDRTPGRTIYRIPTFCGELHLDVTKLLQTVRPIIRSRHPDIDSDEVFRLLAETFKGYSAILPPLLDDMLINALTVPSVDAETPGYLKAVQISLHTCIGGLDIIELLQNPILARTLRKSLEDKDLWTIDILIKKLERLRPHRKPGRKPKMNPKTGKPLHEEWNAARERGEKASVVASTAQTDLKRKISDQLITASWSREKRRKHEQKDASTESFKRFKVAADLIRSTKPASGAQRKNDKGERN